MNILSLLSSVFSKSLKSSSHLPKSLLSSLLYSSTFLFNVSPLEEELTTLFAPFFFGDDVFCIVIRSRVFKTSVELRGPLELAAPAAVTLFFFTSRRISLRGGWLHLFFSKLPKPLIKSFLLSISLSHNWIL